MLKLVSINIARPQNISFEEGKKKYRTGIFKKPVSKEIFLGENGFQGDGVGDTRFHGGKDLAVCFFDKYIAICLGRTNDLDLLGESISFKLILK